MFKGFYTLTSGMMTQNRKMVATSNNMGNVSTPGYKKETVTTTTFKDQLMYQMGSMSKGNQRPMGSTTSAIRVVDGVSSDYTQGPIEETGIIHHFAIMGDGFFEIDSDDGTVYTRNGAFALDEDGYLCLPGVGRVIGDGNEIELETDDFTVDQFGNIIIDGDIEETLTVTVFDEPENLVKLANGMYNGDNAGGDEPDEEDRPGIAWKHLEKSNVNSMQEMTDMMSTQRALQSSSQMLKMYDQLMGRMVSELAKI